MKRIALVAVLATLAGCIEVDRAELGLIDTDLGVDSLAPDTLGGGDTPSGSDGDPADDASTPDTDAGADATPEDADADAADAADPVRQACDPCAATADCAEAGLSCVALGQAGAFCAAPCEDHDDCPEGYACDPVSQLEHDGPPAPHCVPTQGECACSPAGVALGAWTPCWDGACGGQRGCTEAGLSACDAPAPVAEKCDGVDNDCNGQTDEVCDPPPPPTLTATDPGSPSPSVSPTLKGTAQPGLTVRAFVGFACEGPPAAQGVAEGGAFALPLTVFANADVPLYAETISDVGVASSCAGPLVYHADTLPPDLPVLIGSQPASPSNEKFPVLEGTAEPGATVLIWAGAACDGVPVAEAVADATGAFETDPVEVAQDAATAFSLQAVDAAGNASGCLSEDLTYVHDGTPPAPPFVLALAPEASNTSPEVSVTVLAGPFETVRLHQTADCSDAPVATDEADFFGDAHFTVTVASTVTVFHARAVDAAGNVSACSPEGLTFVYDTLAPDFAGLAAVVPVAPDAVTLQFPPPIDDHHPTSSLQLDVCLSPEPDGCLGDFVVHQVVSAATGEAMVTGLAANTRYFFLARARDPLGNVDANTKVVEAVTLTPRATLATASGGAHACALLADGTVRCWGAGDSGQLGDGLMQDAAQPVTAVDAKGAKVQQVRRLGAGDGHTCAAHQDGTVSCWGDNTSGQLGKSIEGKLSASAVKVAYVDGAIDLAVGARHACALRSTGAVACWGDNEQGQLGNLASKDPQPMPQQAIASGMRSVVAGEAFACALGADGVVRCWGDNLKGQLGRGVISETETPAAVTASTGLDIARVVAAGARHACAIRGDGAVFCWGDNGDGQLGVNPVSTQHAISPLQVTGLQGVRALALGDAFSCALMGDGDVRCWGSNAKGQLGTEAVGSGSVAPAWVELPGRARAVSAGREHACAVMGTGRAYCWGALPGLGSGSSGESLPTAVDGLHAASSMIALSTGRDATCGVSVEGEVRCWGAALGHPGEAPVDHFSPQPIDVYGPAVDVQVGGHHACALRADGKVLCWGANGQGQLGVGDGPASPQPTPVILNPRAIAIGVGETHACAITDADELYCWGNNDGGKLGNGNPLSGAKSLPVLATVAPAGLVSVGGGFNHTCVHLAYGEVRCWGANGQSQLGAPASLGSPTALAPAVQGVVELGVGHQFNCVRRVNGSVQCWGANDDKQLGTDTPAAFGTATPVNVPGVTPSLDLSVGHAHACVARSAASVACWGANKTGQLGGGEAFPASSATPVSPSAALYAREIWAGFDHTCAQRADGALLCWGSNDHGEVGVGSDLTPQLSPLVVPDAR